MNIDTNTSKLINIDQNDDHEQAVVNYLNLSKTEQDNSPSIEWINKDNESIKIKEVRDIINQSSYASYLGRQRYYVLLHAEKATIPAQNALLKLIEEPPKDTTFILTTSNLAKLLPTIQSRCVLVKPKSSEENIAQITDPFLAKLSQKPTDVSHGDIIEYVEKYKDRAEAQQFILSQLSQKDLAPNLKENLLESYRGLEKNLNVRLTLEHYLFSYKKSIKG